MYTTRVMSETCAAENHCFLGDHSLKRESRVN